MSCRRPSTPSRSRSSWPCDHFLHVFSPYPGCGTWCGSSSSRHFHRARWRRSRPVPGRQTAVHAAGRARSAVAVRSTPARASVLGGGSPAARRAGRACVARWHAKLQARHRWRRSCHCAAPVLRPLRSRLVAVRRQRDAQQLRNFFLEFDDSLRTLQAQLETGIIALNQGQFASERVGVGGLRSAFG